MRKNKFFPLLMAGACSVGGICWADDPQEKEKPELKVTAVVVNDDNESSKTVQLAEVTPNKLWLGVGLKSIEGDLSDFLGSDKGVLVEEVQEGSPAGKAGILKGDILLSVEGTELKGPGDLLAFMKTAKEGQALTLKLRRKNEELELKVTPAARPKEFNSTFDLGKEMADSGVQFSFDPSKMEVLRMGNPAGIFVPEGLPKGDLQLSLSSSKDGKSVDVKIVRKGDKPAEITVTKDGETKSYTEEQLDQLPEDIRGWIGSVIKPGSRSILLRGLDFGSMEGLKLDGRELRSHLEALAKNSSLPEAAHEALQQALEGVVAGADQAKAAAEAFNSPELRKQLDEIRLRVTAEASDAVAKATADAKQAVIDAEKKARAAQSAKVESKEVEELRQLVNELKKEIAELRAASKQEKTDK